MENEIKDGYRKATENEKDICEYLDDLRDDGSINMMGASPSIMYHFEINKKEAHRILRLWMSNFNPEGTYETVKTEKI